MKFNFDSDGRILPRMVLNFASGLLAMNLPAFSSAAPVAPKVKAAVVAKNAARSVATNEAAGAQLIVLNLQDPLTVSSSSVSRLKAMRTAFENQKFDACIAEAAKSRKIAKSLEPWILALELECASRLTLDRGSPRAVADKLTNILNAADSKTQLMAFGPWATRLRGSWAKARLLAIESDMKTNRPRAWQHVEKLSSALATAPNANAMLDDGERAKLWRLAGELMFLVQKTDGAREFFRRSLAEQDQPDLRDRLKSLNASVPTEANAGPPPPPTPKQPDGSNAEIELADRISNSLKGGDLVAATEDAIKMMHDFPGSPRAKWAADRAQESLISVAEKSGDKFLPVRESILKAMEKGDPDRVAEWARVTFNRGLWAESARLGKIASEKQSGTRSTKTLELALDAAYAIDDFKTVKLLGEELLEKHAGTASARIAALRLGLVAFRQQDYERAAGIFEKLVATVSSESFELQARYWLWRSLEKAKSDRAKIQADELARRYPFSYYGLRARLEAAGGTIDWDKENPVKVADGKTGKSESKAEKIENKVWVTQEEKMSFDRALILISAGWFDDAQLELALLPAAVTPDAKAVRARLWAAAKNFLLASKLANDAWDAKFELRRPELMTFVWPSEYRELFDAAAKAKNLDPWLSRSLTKQESGYNRRAVSSSGALGLMQMIPPTVREIADDLKLGKLALPDDMFEPERNIKMGTHYIAKMLNQFKGHVPLALAAYNAGPTRVDRWLKSRPSLQGLETTRSSAPENELWFDEFPFNETSFYVKAILRNIMMYQIVETGTVTAQEPLWKPVLGTPRP